MKGVKPTERKGNKASDQLKPPAEVKEERELRRSLWHQLQSCCNTMAIHVEPQQKTGPQAATTPMSKKDRSVHLGGGSPLAKWFTLESMLGAERGGEPEPKPLLTETKKGNR